MGVQFFRHCEILRIDIHGDNLCCTERSGEKDGEEADGTTAENSDSLSA